MDSLQIALDVLRIFCEPADLLNAVISFCRGNYVEGTIGLICCFPLIGDLIGKGGKYAAGALGVEIKTIDLTFSLTGGSSELIASLRRGLNKKQITCSGTPMGAS